MKRTKNNTQASCCLTSASMGKEDILSAKSLTVVATVLALMVSLAATAAAQSDALRQLYETSATIPTNVESIRAYPVPPQGFNPLTASDEELAAYGIPLRPDKMQHPGGYRQWTRVAQLMSNPRTRWYGELKPRKAHGSLANAAISAVGTQGTSFGPTKATGHGWSGVVNTLPGTKWSSTKSFSWVEAEFPVPVPQQAFNGNGGNICDGDIDQASFWVGLGGMSVTGVNLGNQNNIAQAGVDVFAFCDGLSGSGAYAWQEWYPGPSVQLFSVNPGDDIYVQVQNVSATVATFFIADYTIQQAAAYFITAPSGHELVGNEAEFIVERPAGDSTPTGLYPLANYVWSIWDFSLDEAFTGTEYGPGETSAATYQLSMTDDSGGSIISVPSIDKGVQQMSVMDENCARTGGCTP
jgi:hypothetical protein